MTFCLRDGPVLIHMSSIAKYTEGYIHLERCSPSMPEPEPGTPVSEQFKPMESPRTYYQNVADSIAPGQTARTNPRSLSNSVEAMSSSPPRIRKASTIAVHPGVHDPHISAHEPRAFPGIAHQRERRRSLRISTSGSDGTAPDLSSNQNLDPGLAKLTVREDTKLEQEMEDED
jgi:hypothetical protein